MAYAVGFRHEIKAPSERLLAALRQYGLPYIVKTMEDGQPCYKPLSVTISKPDRFWRVNGKIASKNLVSYLARL